MGNIENLQKSSGKKSNRSLLYAAIIAALLNASNSREIKAGTITDNTRQNIEQIISSDIVSNVQQRTGVKLPTGYDEIFRNLINENILLKDPEISKFIEDFIVKHMNDNRGINKQNQSLFLHNWFIEYASNKDGYDPSIDNDEKRLQDLKKALPELQDVTQQFIDKFQHVAITRIYRQLHGLRDFYCSFKENSQNFSPKEIESKRKQLLELIPICQLFEVDPTKTLNIACEFYGISQEDFVLIQ